MELTSAQVPESLTEVFSTAERIVSAYFADRSEDPTTGVISISGERYVLVSAASLSVEFFSMVEKLFGRGRQNEARDFARNILFDLAHAVGRSDAHRFDQRTGIGDPLERLSAGPVHFAFTGWARVRLLPESAPSPTDDFLLVYDHERSFEADAWLRTGRKPDFPVCIMNAGYSSGWCEQSYDMPLVAGEILCRARGDEACRFIMAPPDRIEQRIEVYLAGRHEQPPRGQRYQIPDFFARKRVEERLRAARDQLEARVVERTADLRAANERLRREMTERARMEKQLRETQRLESLGRLAGGIAHDFNNLLGVIMGYSSILQRRVSEDETMHAMLTEITEAAHLAANLTRQLVTFSRNQVLRTQKLDVNEVVADIARMLRHVLGDDIRLETRLSREPAVVVADPSQLEQMLMNLAVNARDAMDEGGVLTIETKRLSPGEGSGGQATVRLRVTDTGCGMDEETKSRAFDPFFTTKPSGGTGLGLSTVYGIVAQCGGSVTVDSAPNRGTRFDIWLPEAAGDAQSYHPPTRIPEPEQRADETVLLVEDRIAMRALLAQMLEDEGYRVLVAHDPEDAIRIAGQHPEPIHVLLTDVVMPNMSGRHVARNILSLRPDLQVLFISGFSGDASLLDGDMAGRSAFVRKPVTPPELNRALRDLLGSD